MKQFLRTACLLTLIAVAGHSTNATAQSVPSDNEILAAFLNYLNADTDASVKGLKIEMPELVGCDYLPVLANLPNCQSNLKRIHDYKAAQIPNDMKFAKFKSDIASFAISECLTQRNSPQMSLLGCTSQLLAFKDYQSGIAEKQYGSRNFFYKVGEKGNYEGTIIAYIEMRQKGDDEWKKYKVSLNYDNGKLVVTGEDP